MTLTTAAPRPRMRVSFLRVGVVLLCATAIGWTGVRAVSAVVTTPATPGPSVFAAYVDVTVTPAYPFETPAGPAQSNVILSFVTAGADDDCTPMWGGVYTLDAAASELELDRRMSQLRLTGGDARVSFGGQRGDELAIRCTSPTALSRAYEAVVDRYELTSIDLDIEGAALDDTAGAERRAVAIKDVQDRAADDGRSLAVWLTLPVAPTGLTGPGEAVVAGMLSAGVELAGVNGMTMDFNSGTTPGEPYSDVVVRSATALHTQVRAAFARAGQALSIGDAWGKVGITPMIGQNDVISERFTLADAGVLNEFARTNGVGALSMWSLNRDATCGPPLPSVLSVVQTSCSGVDQGAQRFAVVLSADLTAAPFSPAPSPSASEDDEAATPTVTAVVDDPAHSPFPIWDALGTYPAGTKTVWHGQVFQARYWTSGFAPDTPVAAAEDSPWTLIGPVLPGDTPAPLPTLPAGSYPQWDATTAYLAGTRVQLDLVPYEAKWWSQGQTPGESVAGGSPWVLVQPS
ncbi:chitinase [Pengzhenrongella frigida]|uniref:Glycosyl hydrolase family 18 n=1 Tax=Pengzhenrongella frigida TaxID=1259133 RepID=A0A4Q5MZN1_9MICO|nr:glycosyl hydrolase family 18 [Cellulomonas sp. HLT2-17]RYV50393.1 glycosyl hydrolase family 18 [Cellulomonas sp. HLT2-17]